MPNKKTTSAKKLARKKRIPDLPTPPAATMEKPLQIHHQIDSFVFNSNEARGQPSEELKPGSDLPEDVVVLEGDSRVKGGKCYVYLVSVCHGLAKSCDNVRTMINLVKPDVVFFELCDFRAKYAFAPSEVSGTPVNEMLVGYEEARKCGARIDLGDIPWEISLRRILGEMSSDPMLKNKFRKYKNRAGDSSSSSEEEEEEEEFNIAEIFEEVKKEKELGFLPEDMREDFPFVEKYWIDERGMFMSTTLLNLAKEFKTIVAIVSWANLQGIKRNWKHPVDVASLLEVPSKRPSDLAVKMLQLIHPCAAEYLESMFMLMKN